MVSTRSFAVLLAFTCLASPSLAQHSMAGAMAGVHPSVNMTNPCYAEPWEESCTNFRRMHSEWTDDMISLCTAMPYMVGCTLYKECKPMLDQKKEIELNGARTNVSAAFGTFCGMNSLVADVCVEMPKMKGCEAYNTLCSENSTVATCFTPGPIPNVLWTWDTKEAVDEICATKPQPACAQCSSPGRMNMTVCPDPLSTLKLLCDADPAAPQCAELLAMCDVEGTEVLVSTCAAPYGSSMAVGGRKMLSFA